MPRSRWWGDEGHPMPLGLFSLPTLHPYDINYSVHPHRQSYSVMFCSAQRHTSFLYAATMPMSSDALQIYPPHNPSQYGQAEIK
jgi:hypothetical protein